MSIKTAAEKPHGSYRRLFFRSSLLVLFILVAVLVLVEGTLGGRSDSPSYISKGQSANEDPRLRVATGIQPETKSSASFGVVLNPSPTPTPEPGNRAGSPFPDNLTWQPASIAPSSSLGTQVYINFDDVPSGTLITNQYSPAVFSTDWPLYTFANSQHYYYSSAPNHLDRGPTSNAGSGFAPVYVDFTKPVNDLRFYLLAADDFRSGIAQLHIFRYGTLVSTRSLDGRGVWYTPILIDIGGTVSSGGMGYDNVTRIEIVNMTDTRGLAVDDFSFTVPAPTPIPTPTPLPTPFPPTNLFADVDKNKVSLVWDSAGAVSYNVKRRSTISEWTRIATGLLTTRYEDSSAIPDTSYFYAVTAVNAHGESADSSIVSAMLVPSCGDYVEPRPAQEQYPDRGNGWTLTAEVSDRDGLVLSDVSLNGRYMARMMSVPYFYLKTNKMIVAQKGELNPNSTSPTMRARLLSYSRPVWYSSVDGHVVDFHIRAQYAVDRITPTSKSCLVITQDYEFDEKRPGDLCEPSGRLPCSRFYPRVSYKFEGRDGETLESINVAQRLHYRVNGKTEGTIGVFRDCDVPFLQCGSSGGAVFEDSRNPVENESLFEVLRDGRDIRSWDNIHQTHKDTVEHPLHGLLHGHAGCPECVHTHWRWGTFFGYQFGSGRPIIGDLLFNPTHQDLDIGILRYKAGEEHPNTDFKSLLSSSESIRNVITRVVGLRPLRRRIEVLLPADVLYWYSATSHEPSSDLFFKHGSFFNPDEQQQATALKSSSGSSDPTVASQDGVRSITYGYLYLDGPTTFSTVDPGTVASLPAGYALVDNAVHRITTDAIVSGPHLVSFDVPSINDQTAFNNLAIFHLEPDPFDPDNLIWVDTTILSPDTPAPDFTNRIIHARIDDVGHFAIGKLVQPQPDPGSSDLSITVGDSPDPVVVENNLTYTLHITNNGPQTATAVGLIDVLPQETAFVSASPTQGNCKYKSGSVYCKIGTIVNGGSADVTIVARPREDRAGLPSQGKSIANTVVVAADNDDSILENNFVTGSTLVLPSSNARPSVIITTPGNGETVVGPLNLTVRATALDTDGTVSRVDFFEGGTLIGTATPTGTVNQYGLSWNAGLGSHSIIAVATDNGGRSNSSDPVNLFVNGAGIVSITSPTAGGVFEPFSNVAITASASHPSQAISKVEFFADTTRIGEGSLTGSGQYSVTWTSAPHGAYSLIAVLTDASGGITNSPPVNITVTSKPGVTILTPLEGASFPTLSRVTITASTQDSDGFVSKVDFYASGALIGTGSSIGQDRFAIDWAPAPDGVHTLTAIVMDNLGSTTASAPVNIGINTPAARPGEFIWFDDALPTGAVKRGDSDGDWYWVEANPGAFSGTKSHQSKNVAQLEVAHQHYFDSATAKLPVNAGDKLFTYVFLDVNSMPREIMLQWHDGNNWEHRAYWGQNNIGFGIEGTDSRRYMGAIPRAGQWVRLEVPASLVGLEGSTLSGMAFTLDGGRATWDFAGKATANVVQPPPTFFGDVVWIEDALPAGAVTSVIDDVWNWVPSPVNSGQVAHQSYFRNDDNKKFRSHSFVRANTPMTVNPGEALFTYVYLGDPDLNHQPFTPDQIMVQWYDGTSWEHRAFWGENFIGQQFPSLGTPGTESQRFMGGLPPARGWYRLEVPASYVGLEGKSVSGMAFSVFRNGRNPFVTWDRAGKVFRPTTVPISLSATTGVWRLYNSNQGYAFETNDQGPPQYFPQTITFYVHPNQAAGTVPFYRFRRPGTGNQEYFYSRSLSYNGNGWVLDGTAFYVYPDATTPGTVPLYLYHDNQSHYFLTTNQNEAVGMTLDGIWAYVFATNRLVPAKPHLHTIGNLSCDFYWTDNSSNETGFKIERKPSWENNWTQIAVVGANVTQYDDVCVTPNPPAPASPIFYRLRGTNAFGDSEYSNEQPTCTKTPCMIESSENTPPEVSISSPSNGSVVVTTFDIAATVFDSEGLGTIARVEFFANGSKLGESLRAPYRLAWSNAPSGQHSLTVVATDTGGASTISAAVSVLVSRPPMTSITAPANGSVFTAPANILIQANASDPEGTIAKVEFFQNDIKIGEVNTTPYSLNWANVSAGGYQLSARVTDNSGLSTASPLVTITVNSPPTISLFSPQNGLVVQAPASLAVSANAGDIDGEITKVEFYQGLSLIGTAMAPPFSIAWNSIPVGNYSLTAKATDDRGASSTSSVVSITVNNTTSGRLNVALAANGGVGSSSSNYSDGTYNYTAAGVINGLRSGANVAGEGWCDAAPGYTFPDWLQVDFNGSKTIDEIDVFTTQDNWANPSEPTEMMTFTAYGLIGYDVQYWNSKLGWVTVPAGSVSGNNKVWRKFSFKAITTTKIRVLTNASPDGYSRLTEVEAWSAETGGGPAPILSDDFNDNVRDAAKWNLYAVGPNPSPVYERNGRLEIQSQYSATNSNYGGYVTAATHNLNGKQTSVEVVQPTTGNGGGGNYAGLSWGDSPFRIMMTYHYIYYDNISFIFDPVRDRYIRLRDDATTQTVYYESSSNGVAWEVRAQRARGAASLDYAVRLYNGNTAGWTSVNLVVFDNFRIEESGSPSGSQGSGNADINWLYFLLPLKIFPDPRPSILQT
jgi:uncharacterized repeat protein (TIGR01451 family)